MNTSFYTAALGAKTQQERLNVVANNLANVNTNGYKAKTATFEELMYHNMREHESVDSNLTSGAGATINHTNTDFRGAGYAPDDSPYSFAIEGDGFFMLQDAATNELYYTRNGKFSVSSRPNGFFLVNDAGKLVLDANKSPIQLVNGKLNTIPAVFDFENYDGMESVGANMFQPLAKNGEPTLNPSVQILEKRLEMSNVDTAYEMSELIEASRAYSYVLKMVQTSDEVTQTINELRR